jgi:hypothetical protein
MSAEPGSPAAWWYNSKWVRGKGLISSHVDHVILLEAEIKVKIEKKHGPPYGTAQHCTLQGAATFLVLSQFIKSSKKSCWVFSCCCFILFFPSAGDGTQDLAHTKHVFYH